METPVEAMTKKKQRDRTANAGQRQVKMLTKKRQRDRTAHTGQRHQ